MTLAYHNVQTEDMGTCMPRYLQTRSVANAWATARDFWAGPLLLAFFRMHSDLVSSSRFSCHGVLCKRRCVLWSKTGLRRIDWHLAHFVCGFARGLRSPGNLHRCHFPTRRNSTSNRLTRNCSPLQAGFCGRCNILYGLRRPDIIVISIQSEPHGTRYK